MLLVPLQALSAGVGPQSFTLHPRYDVGDSPYGEDVVRPDCAFSSRAPGS